MSYTVELTTRAEKALRKLDKPIRRRVLAALDQLATTPRPPGCIKLTGAQAWRIRVGDWRIIYEVHDDRLVVLILDVAHRSVVYRDPD